MDRLAAGVHHASGSNASYLCGADEAAKNPPSSDRSRCTLNTPPLQLSGIDEDFRVTDGGPIRGEGPQTGELTGILRSCNRFIKSKPTGKEPTQRDRYDRLRTLLQAYNAVGITGICDGAADPEDLQFYQKLLAADELTVRVAAQYYIDTIGPIEEIQEQFRRVARLQLREGGPMLRIIGIKAFLDGGMLTGSAYMRQPWGVSKTYAIDDPNYCGVLFIPHDRLLPSSHRHRVRPPFTHTVGDGAVHALLDVYDELSATLPVRQMRHCITHSNFMSAESVAKTVDLGVIPLVQPAWLYLDTRTLAGHFGYERLRYFQPLHSIFAAGGLAAGGSDQCRKSVRCARSIRMTVPRHVDHDSPGTLVRPAASEEATPASR